MEIGDIVQIELPNGKRDRGEIVRIIQSSNFSTLPTEYGIRLDSTNLVQYFSEKYVKIDPVFSYWSGIMPTCDCGADKAHYPRKAPGHAQWCSKGKMEEFWK